MGLSRNIQALLDQQQRHQEQQAEAMLTTLRGIVEQFQKRAVKELRIDGLAVGNIPDDVARKLIADHERLMITLDKYPDAQITLNIASEVTVKGGPLLE